MPCVLYVSVVAPRRNDTNRLLSVVSTMLLPILLATEATPSLEPESSQPCNVDADLTLL